MAEDKIELRNVNFRQAFPWMELFRGFKVAVDPKKLLLAAGGILVMACGWWLLAVIFFSSRTEPSWGSRSSTEDFTEFRNDRIKWNLLYEAAGDRPVEPTGLSLADDFAQNPEEHELIKKAFEKGDFKTEADIKGGLAGKVQESDAEAGAKYIVLPNRLLRVPQVPSGGSYKPYGKLRTWPWFEDRGDNPYLLVTGQAGQTGEEGLAHYVPWGKGHFWDWLFGTEVPVLVEPLVKFLRPVVYLLRPNGGFWNRVYFLLVLLWTLLTWAFFGGAITRMAAVEVARREKIGMGEAIRFTLSHYLSFFSAPIFPLLGVLLFVVFLIVFGLFHLIPVFGDIVVDGLGWPLVLLSGLFMAVVLVGLVCWPMMYATISAEGSDSFDALSRSYSYLYQSPWQYLWYALVALAYGMVVVFFVGFMGSLVVYLGKWSISQTPLVSHNWSTKDGKPDEFSNREPEFLFIFAPRSYHWRELLLKDAGVVNADGQLNPKYLESFSWYNYVGAFLVGGIWLHLVFLLVLGFGYSYFWSVSTIIYLLMRRKVDDTELDEVYLEEDESEDAYRSPLPVSAPAPIPAGTPASSGTNLQMVEAPTLKPSAPAPPASPPPSPLGTAPADGGDASPPAGSQLP
jgi:hypothetical protein